MASPVESALKLLDDLQRQHTASLARLSEPLLSPPGGSEQSRKSDASGAPSDNGHPTPASLAADLAHYKDLFTKLRFSYTEQVTKEKFLRNLVSDPPAHIDPASNAELEGSLAGLKATLQAQKASVNDLVAQLEAQARELCRRQQVVDEHHSQLREMPGAVATLQAEIGRMRQEQGIVAAEEAGEGQSDLHLGLEQTVELVEEREEKLNQLDRQLDSLAEERSTREQALKRAQDGLRSAQRARDQAVKSASEAQKRRRDGKDGVGDEIEQRGRWLRGVESTMKNLLEIEA